ncbi:IS66 family insertion sequence element accessory protein TnpB [Acidisoma silvae]|uniref:IS66 family insertion sequence element accessory protein TnpB n=1 Tax=Acidisoma silvae TaxID=2802396 RepID=A0A963YXI6_9PROT|nr:IS66 family insertion sequence element accessory protein TnpB [Acidisoma silvae]
MSSRQHALWLRWSHGAGGPILGVDPVSGQVFIFCGKRADYLKFLYYDGS